MLLQEISKVEREMGTETVISGVLFTLDIGHQYAVYSLVTTLPQTHPHHNFQNLKCPTTGEWIDYDTHIQ